MARPRGNKKQREVQERMATATGKVIGYARVSTTGQGENGHSLDGQRTRMREAATREGLELVAIVEEVASGRKDRDGLKEAQARIMAGEAQGLLVPKIDRLGRSTIGLLRTVKWAEDNRVDILSVSEGWIVRHTPEGVKLDEMLTGRAWFAELEARKISERTREGLAAAKAKGVHLGRPVENNGELARRATELRRQGQTFWQIANAFNAEGLTTKRGNAFDASGIYRMVNREDPTANPEGGHRGNVVAAVAA